LGSSMWPSATARNSLSAPTLRLYLVVGILSLVT
jgi:hypothetical protein